MIEFVSDTGETYRYNPADRIGKPGGYGTVFQGVAPDGSPVAVKIVSTDRSADDRVLAEREVDIWRQLPVERNNHLIPLLDVAHQSDRLVLVMPRARRSLADLIAQEAPLSSADAADIIRQIAIGLQDLISVGVIHRDIKPANILELEGRWHLADFGISRLITAKTGTLTFRGNGTLEYRAPELWPMENESVASDLYALGCVGYELVTGRKAFPGPDFRKQHKTLVRSLPDGVDAALRAVILDLLAKQPASRPPDARSVVDALKPNPGLTSGQMGLQRMLAHAASARMAREAEDSVAAEYADRQEEASRRLSYLWKSVIDKARAVDRDAEFGEAAGGEPYLIIGDSRLMLRIGTPAIASPPLLLVGALTAALRDYPGNCSPANLACLWGDGAPEWFILRFMTQPESSLTGAGTISRNIYWAENNFKVDDRTLIFREPATADLILDLFNEAIGL